MGPVLQGPARVITVIGQASVTDKGHLYEQKACTFLKQQGLKQHQSNYRCCGEEIDLIMTEGKCLIFVEVRYRHSDQFGSGAESIDFHKQARLIQCANHYLQKHGKDTQAARFDVISIGMQDGAETIQ